MTLLHAVDDLPSFFGGYGRLEASLHGPIPEPTTVRQCEVAFKTEEPLTDEPSSRTLSRKPRQGSFRVLRFLRP